MSILEVVLIIFSVALAIAWVPVALYFVKAWRKRRSRLALAICAMSAYPIFINISSIVFLSETPENIVRILVCTNFLVLINYVMCFRWQQERFAFAKANGLKSTGQGKTESGEMPQFPLS